MKSTMSDWSTSAFNPLRGMATSMFSVTSRAARSRARLSLSSMLMLVLLAAIAQPGWASTIASVVGVENGPRLLSDTGGRELKMADQLQMGDRLELKSGARALLMYAQTFQVFAVQGPALVTVLPDAAVATVRRTFHGFGPLGFAGFSLRMAKSTRTIG